MKGNRLLDLSLYLVTDQKLAENRDLIDLILKAIRGGVTAVQLREKDIPAREFYQLALQVRKAIPREIPLIINDRLDIALAAGADGLHLGQADLPAGIARQHFGPQAIIGLSIENIQQLKEARHLPVNYLAISPVFPTPTKADTGPAWGLAGLKTARQLTDLPLVVIGGLNERNAATVMETGVDGLAVVSAICSQPDPERAARRLKSIITEARKNKHNRLIFSSGKSRKNED
ncbi:MAG: thiamine phosphate synthase [Acidobacteriota bacterium]|nr:thiamine phosphate synthase [Acidobacteriota bacterium]